MVEPGRAVRPGHDDLGSVAPRPSGRRWRCRRSAPAARSTRAPATPSIDRPAERRVDDAGRHDGRDELRPAKCAPPSVDLYITRTACRRAADPEDVDVAPAVGAHRAAVGLGVVAVVRRRADLLRGPRVAAVAGAGHVQRRRQRLALAVAAERRPADVDVAEEPARRRVVGPDLLLVGERGRGLLGDEHRRDHARVRPRGRGRDVVGARDGDRLEALERLLGTRRRRSSRSGSRSRAASRCPGERAVRARAGDRRRPPGRRRRRGRPRRSTGSVPIGPTCGGAASPGPRQSRAVSRCTSAAIQDAPESNEK